MSPNSLLKTLISDYPEFSFLPGDKFRFHPKSTIYYISPSNPSSVSISSSRENPSLPPASLDFSLSLLHELAHALLGHFSYHSQLNRLKLERDAWEKTAQLCKKYDVPFNSDFAEDNLDTYRLWLHQKTLCKSCGSTCVELSLDTLFCPLCQKTFHKNSLSSLPTSIS